VRVDVEDRDRAAEPVCERRRRCSGVVEVTGTAVARSANVMARRAATRVGAGRACSDEIDGGQRHVDGSARGVPGAGAD